jgi:hypothetical protein
MSIGFCLFFFFEKRKPPKQFYRSPTIKEHTVVTVKKHAQVVLIKF